MPKIKKALEPPAEEQNTPNGSTRWGYTIDKQFREALAQVEKEKGVSLLVHALRIAYTEKTVLVRFLDKIIPDVKSDSNINFTGDLAIGDLSDDELQKAIIQLLTIKAGGSVLPRARTEHTESPK